MDNFVLEAMQNGKDINEILNTPFHYVIQLLEEKNKPQKVKSVMDLP